MSDTTLYKLQAKQNELLAEEIKRDYKELRANADADLIRVEFPFGGEAWMSLKYDVTRGLYADPRFGVEKFLELDDYPRIRQTEKGARPSFLMYDGVKHQSKRAVLMKHLTVKRVNVLRAQTQQLIEETLDEFEQLGSPANITDVFARIVPVKVLCALLGAPPITDPAFLEASYFIVDSRAMTMEEVYAAHQVVNKYFAEMYEERKRNPGDDLLSALIKDTESGKWDADELQGLGFTLLAAGHDATGSMLNGILEFLSYDPALFQRLRREPEALPRAMEEFYRCVSVGIGIAKGRIALEDVEVGGVLVREGEVIGGNIVASHHDPDAYPNPDVLDIDRQSPPPHMAFGYGPHACVGAQLARMEIGLAIETVLKRYNTFSNVLSADGWRERRGMKGPKELVVNWERA